MISSISENNKNTISREEFKKFMTARLVIYFLFQDHRDDPDDIKGAFDYLDGSKKGKISSKDLEKMAE